jgi:TRAP-type C4-dicarboxylate transport system substrate-binding protein
MRIGKLRSSALTALLLTTTVWVLEGAASAEPKLVMKLATSAPSGSEWAHEAVAFARRVERDTSGEVGVKWYFDGIAGDELEVVNRIARKQLDGLASGGLQCERVMPSMRILGLAGMFQTHDESAMVLTKISDTLKKEAAQSEFAFLGSVNLGPYMIFSRTPVASMDELRHIKLWTWNLLEDDVKNAREMGIQVVPGRINDAASDFEAQKFDGFLTFPAAALAWQWSARVKYVTDLRLRFRCGCLLIASRTFDRLKIEHQQAVRDAMSVTLSRIDELGRRHDEALLGGLFEKQGVKTVPVAETFRAEFFEAAENARDRLSDKIVSRELIARVLQWLADYRGSCPA